VFYKDLIKSSKNEYNAKYLLKNHIKLTNDELNNKKNIPILKLLKFNIALIKSKKKPLQYIVGTVNFYGYEYKVNKNVLIPRFETEQLVEETIKLIKKDFKDKRITLLDLGTGSGCIGITIKKELKNIDVTLSDISKEALKIAKFNAKNENIRIIKSNLFENINKKYDVIISNPPYLSYNEPVEDIVKNNEPNIALYAKNKGLYYYEEILKYSKRFLKDKYIIAFEIGLSQAQNIIKIANKYLDNINFLIKKDLNEKDRILIITNF